MTEKDSVVTALNVAQRELKRNLACVDKTIDSFVVAKDGLNSYTIRLILSDGYVAKNPVTPGQGPNLASQIRTQSVSLADQIRGQNAPSVPSLRDQIAMNVNR